jgi:ribosomal subunit interface protein
MRVIISARGLTVSPTYRAHLQERIEKIARLSPKATEARVVLARERNLRTAGVTLVAKLHTFRSEETAPDLAAAVDAALAALTRQVRQLKDRIQTHKPPRKSPRAVAWRGAAEGEPSENIEITPVPAKPMSVEEALEQFRMSRDPFFAFTNAVSGVVNVLYRRRGGLGLIEPMA